MHAALQQLPADQRAAIVLVDMEGFAVAEAAEILEVPVGTVKSRCARGRARLAGLLGYLRNPDDDSFVISQRGPAGTAGTGRAPSADAAGTAEAAGGAIAGGTAAGDAVPGGGVADGTAGGGSGGRRAGAGGPTGTRPERRAET